MLARRGGKATRGWHNAGAGPAFSNRKTIPFATLLIKSAAMDGDLLILPSRSRNERTNLESNSVLEVLAQPL
jgi:hypothetical protein